MTPQQGKKFIFISYAHKDSRVVMPLLQGLMARNFNVWYDDSIEAGYEWPEYIATNLLASECVIVFMSPNADASHNCRQELTYAINKRKKLIVVYLENFQPSPGTEMQLDNLHALYLSNYSNNEAFLDQLARERRLQPCLQKDTPDPQPRAASPKKENAPVRSSVTPTEQKPAADTKSETAPRQAQRSAADVKTETAPKQTKKPAADTKADTALKHAQKSASSSKAKAASQQAQKSTSKVVARHPPLTFRQKRIKRALGRITCLLELSYCIIGGLSLAQIEKYTTDFSLIVALSILPHVAIALINKLIFMFSLKGLPEYELSDFSLNNAYCWLLSTIGAIIYGSFCVSFSDHYILNLLSSLGLNLLPASISFIIICLYTYEYEF